MKRSEANATLVSEGEGRGGGGLELGRLQQQQCIA